MCMCFQFNYVAIAAFRRASVKAKDDDISLKAEKGELLGDKEKFHKFNWDQDVKICKSFIDSNYFPLCTRESVKPNDYSTSSFITFHSNFFLQVTKLWLPIWFMHCGMPERKN